jgi:hypothetical protein
MKEPCERCWISTGSVKSEKHPFPWIEVVRRNGSRGGGMIASVPAIAKVLRYSTKLKVRLDLWRG